MPYQPSVLDDRYAELKSQLENELTAIIEQLRSRLTKQTLKAPKSTNSNWVSERQDEFLAHILVEPSDEGAIEMILLLLKGMQESDLNAVGTFFKSNTSLREELKTFINHKAHKQNDLPFIDTQKRVKKLFAEYYAPVITNLLSKQMQLAALDKAKSLCSMRLEQLNEFQSALDEQGVDIDQIEIIQIKRHEVSTNKTKVLGLRIDAPLSVTDNESAQTLLELTTVRDTMDYYIQLLKTAEPDLPVNVLLSPGTRAVQTMVMSTVPPTHSHSVHIDTAFAETQGKYTKSCIPEQPEVQKTQLEKLSYQNISTSDPHTFAKQNETEQAFTARLERASELIRTPPPEDEELSVKWLVAHGGLNKKLWNELKEHYDVEQDEQKLSYGESFIMFRAFNEGNEIAVMFIPWRENRYGMPTGQGTEKTCELINVSAGRTNIPRQ